MSFKVGFSRVKITPEVGARLFGYPGARASSSLHDDLFINAFAFWQDGREAMLISVDLCQVHKADCDAARRMIAEKTSIPFENTIICSIHTHSGPSPDRCSSSLEGGWAVDNSEYLDEVLIPRLVEAAEKAKANSAPAVMGVSQTESKIGINRRERRDGEVVLGQNPDGPMDLRMRAISFKGEDGKTIATLIHYGCHPTSAGQAPDISRDWPGYMTDAVEEESGAPCVFINGAEGDVGPRLSNGLTTGDMAQTEEIGIKAGKDAVMAFKAVSEFKEPELKVGAGTIKIPYQPLPSKEEILKELDRLGDPLKLIEVDILLYERCKDILKYYEDGLPQKDFWTDDVTYIALGDVLFVPFPWEMFCTITMNLQDKSPFEHTLCLSNANGAYGYMPTEDELPFGGYEIDSFRSFDVFVLADNAGDIVVDENIRLINELF